MHVIFGDTCDKENTEAEVSRGKCELWCKANKTSFTPYGTSGACTVMSYLPVLYLGLYTPASLNLMVRISSGKGWPWMRLLFAVEANSRGVASWRCFQQLMKEDLLKGGSGWCSNPSTTDFMLKFLLLSLNEAKRAITDILLLSVHCLIVTFKPWNNFFNLVLVFLHLLES